MAQAERAITWASNDAEALVPAVMNTLRAWKDDHILLFALSKSLPRPALSQLVSQITTSVPPHARVGMLTTALPSALVPHAHASSPLHAATLAAIPFQDAVTFRSTIRGAPRIAVGRWTMQKDLWHMGTEVRADGLDRTGEWTSLWGRENAEERVPASLASLQPRDIDAMLVCTDPRPEGLWEGLDAQFPHAHIVGATAALTPFETGREHTLLGAGIYEDGAVGLAWRRPTSRLCRTLGGLVPLGPRLGVTGYVWYTNSSARGNIISSLNDHNAAQQFLHLVLERRAAPREPMDRAQLRTLSSEVRRDDDFFMGLYAHENDEMPLLVARIQAGHPMRGTLGLDTQSELEGLARYAQVFRAAPHSHVLTDEPDGTQAGVQYMWVMEHATPAHVPQLAAPDATGDVWVWEQLFLAGAESNWFSRTPGSRTRACAVPQSSVVLCRS